MEADCGGKEVCNPSRVVREGLLRERRAEVHEQ